MITWMMDMDMMIDLGVFFGVFLLTSLRVGETRESNVVSIRTDRHQLTVPHPFPEPLRKVDHVNTPSSIQN